MDNNVYSVAKSTTGLPNNSNDRGRAQSCIGQRYIRMTPLQGAVIAAAIANNGTHSKVDWLYFGRLLDWVTSIDLGEKDWHERA